MIGIATSKTRVGSICLKLKLPAGSGLIANRSAIRDSSRVSKPESGRIDSAAHDALNCRDVPDQQSIKSAGDEGSRRHTRASLGFRRTTVQLATRTVISRRTRPVTVCRPNVAARLRSEPQTGGNTVQPLG